MFCCTSRETAFVDEHILMRLDGTCAYFPKLNTHLTIQIGGMLQTNGTDTTLLLRAAKSVKVMTNPLLIYVDWME